MKCGYKFRIYPTDEQKAELARTFGCVRHVWNWALECRTRAWYDRQQRIGYAELARLSTAHRNNPDFGWLTETSQVPQQQVLRHQQTAFSNFWAKRAKYPTFKSKHDRQSIEYTVNGFRLRDDQLFLAKMSGPIDVRWSRELPSEPTTATVSRDNASRYFVSFLCERDVEPLVHRDETVGLDMGLTSLVTLSTGEKIVNHRHARSDQRLAKAQRQLANKQKGSQNRKKARLRVARIHARIADRRRDQLHQLSTRLVRENQTIVIEDLAVGNMVRNRHLARAISDVGWRQLRTMLEYKAEWYGRELVVVSRWFPSSRRCSTCGTLHTRLGLGERQWTCGACDAVHDRDVNAAVNIRAAGLAVQACGDGVRHDGRSVLSATIGEAGNPRTRVPGIPRL